MTDDPAPRYQLIRDLEQHQAARLAAELAAHPAPCRSSADPGDRASTRAILDGMLKTWPISSGDGGQGDASAV